MLLDEESNLNASGKKKSTDKLPVSFNDLAGLKIERQR